MRASTRHTGVAPDLPGFSENFIERVHVVKDIFNMAPRIAVDESRSGW